MKFTEEQLQRFASPISQSEEDKWRYTIPLLTLYKIRFIAEMEMK